MNNDFDQDDINETEEPTALQKFKEWVQENLRIIVSVLIVFLIASSIYSYSKRGAENTEVAQENNEIEDILTDLSSEESTETSEEAPAEEENEGEEVATNTQESETPQVEEQKVEAPKQESAPKVTESTETENSFVEVAQQGDGTTHLARKALANYLEKNADSSLTAEHKIYIEDYLRKNISQRGSISLGTSQLMLQKI
ncbi:MAG: hypothetical protein UR60_C0015G0012 [Candidatus Moranbacteria bacterium GW2011_GWF2_34_56]|nr:MAG: hypothetical protein UR60_C0015G0012 [Candidatus Moranbacteria bacterium GW2011_GWF2_34_56]